MSMEARVLRAALLVVAAVMSLGANRPYQSARSQNFLVSAPTPQLAEEICRAAETYRRDLALEWLGHELPAWSTPCPIRADVAPGLGAGGATSFVFQNNQPGQWTMQIQGSRERILDSVLPHEVTHTIFATHFGRPLPRWADEGACTTVEHDSEKAKQDKFLIQFLTSNPPRGIAFNKMFQMKEYPRDILPLYSQGYSLAKFFIHQGGKRKFVEYVGEGMRTNNWTATTQKYYGFGSLSDLQLTWVEWVRHGSPALPDGKVPEMLLVSTQSGQPQSRNIGQTQMASLSQPPQSRVPGGPPANWQTISAQNERTFAGAQASMTTQQASLARPAVTPIETSATSAESSSVSRPYSEGWYAKRRDQAQAALQSGPQNSLRVDGEDHSPATGDKPPTTDATPAEPVTRKRIEATPATPPATKNDGRVLLEWTRPADQPYRPSAELTGVAIRDAGTVLR
jgi:hypothetical protein